MGLAVIAWVSLAGTRLEAQACETGRVPVDGGYCCWPGQTFDVAANRCSGAPICPEGFLGSGAECVLASPATSSPPPPTPAVIPTPSGGVTIRAGSGTSTGRGWDPEHDDTHSSSDRRTNTGRGWSPEDPRAAIPPSRTERHARVGLIAGGAALFFPAYLGAVLSHYALGTNDYWTAPNWPLTFVPVLHNLAMIDNGGGDDAAGMWAIGFFAGALEIAGLVMMIVGQRGSEELVEVDVAEVEISLLAAAPNTDAGASLRLVF
jgi:hypothetical protein